MTLQTYCEPIRKFPVDEITTEDVLGILQPLWTRVPETAKRLRGRIENVLDAARAVNARPTMTPPRTNHILLNINVNSVPRRGYASREA
jgi:Phage integrase central domain